MATMLCRTKGNASPGGKPRVYFTCHPEDFDKYFDKLSEDIFKTHSCAIFYTEDMTEIIAEEDKATELESNNLFIVPVTFRLLLDSNRAMNEDIPYALEKHIPILPFMMERGLDVFYSAKFGELQYLNPFSTDLTEISYEEKLKKYLESVLISDETAKRIRAAFDAYIFLSYRKKDRRYANELMRLIHRHPECRDIAVWYDEFLVPGESFRENIQKMLNSSKLFALLVTPNLLEEPEGKPNFVMDKEYPAAHSSGIDILPAEMEETDKEALGKKFEGIPPCIKPEEEAFKTRLLEAVAKIATTANDEDPTHTFLIGLAYLEGIDVETDRQRGLTLITAAAEQGLPEAMEKLYRMYDAGTGVSLSYRESAKWAERLAEYHQKTLGREHPDTLYWINCQTMAYTNMGAYSQAKELTEQVYALACKVLGEEDPITLVSLHNLAVIHGRLGEYEKARELYEKAYALRRKVLGEEASATLLTLHNLAPIYGILDEDQKALECSERVHALRCKILGEDHPSTLRSLNNLAFIHSKLGNYQKAREQMEQVYDPLRKTLGEEHPSTLTALSNLAMAYGNLHDHKKQLELCEKAYTLHCKILGEEHPQTLVPLGNLAYAYGKLGQDQKQLELYKKAYALRCKIFGEEHPDTAISLWDISLVYWDLGDYAEAAQLLKKTYDLQQKLLGADHPQTEKTRAHFLRLCKEQALCTHCYGPLKGLFRKKCSKCGKRKDY